MSWEKGSQSCLNYESLHLSRPVICWTCSKNECLFGKALYVITSGCVVHHCSSLRIFFEAFCFLCFLLGVLISLSRSFYHRLWATINSFTLDLPLASYLLSWSLNSVSSRFDYSMSPSRDGTSIMLNYLKNGLSLLRLCLISQASCSCFWIRNCILADRMKVWKSSSCMSCVI